MESKEERVYEFFKTSVDNKIPEKYSLKESELDDKHINLIVGQILKDIENAPHKVRTKFYQHCFMLMMGKLANEII